MACRKNISSLHLAHNKHTANCKPIRIAVPNEVILPMDMQSGSNAIPIVNVGDHVYVGQLIAKEGERFSSPVHATISGVVKEISPLKRTGGKEVLAIHIESDGKMEKDPSLKAPVITDVDSFLNAVRESGCVGLGGAAFPTWGKLNEMRNKECTVDTVLVNAAECEPYITSDHRMMVDHPDLIVKGVDYLRTYLKEYLNNATFMICIEKNKPDAILAMKEAFASQSDVVIKELKTIYPQGAKQVMLYNATGRVSIAGKRFPYFHAIIINVSSLAKMAEYLSTGMPLVERIVTVDGSAVKEPKNLIAPIGTKISYLLEQTGLKSEPGKVIIGGPMNGHAVLSVDDPIVKVSNCVLAFDEKHSVLPEPSVCIHCGRCIDHCPIKINVVGVDKALGEENEDIRAKKLLETGVRQCVDCASCSYVCPAHRHLLESNQLAKKFLKDYERSHAKEVNK